MKRRIIKSQYGNPGIEPMNYRLYQDSRPEYSMQPNGYVLPEVIVTSSYPKSRLHSNGYTRKDGSKVYSEFLTPHWNDWIGLVGRTITESPERNDTIYFGAENYRSREANNKFLPLAADRRNQLLRKRDFYKEVLEAEPNSKKEVDLYNRIKNGL